MKKLDALHYDKIGIRNVEEKMEIPLQNIFFLEICTEYTHFSSGWIADILTINPSRWNYLLDFLL
ncbi:hypothetical protein DERP_006973 [Dermatophagoides pteronyssinus]|uniref:Uncharacterized protein n=1 Tax=Dermatophagoides pteronyssinus TaxID=6956 RepID=A0ABQ8JUF7_DERPT|nr:hypothetical protein DERP_006973 [Dermatophagoides pteronyssinus]